MYNLRNGFTLLLFMSLAGALYGQDTYSIVAVDTVTREVGSAGASCIGGSDIISDIRPDTGAVHTQAWYRPANQDYARALMQQRYTPAQIIDSLIANDDTGTPGWRQYGIVDFDSSGHPRAAAFTGSNTTDWKGHIEGVHYAIQGNILLGPEILDAMKDRFVNSSGDLAERLMAALQGANVPGADTRCMADSISSLSAFIRVAKPDNTPDSLWLDLVADDPGDDMEPVNCVQGQYDIWKSGDCSPLTASFTQSKDTVYLDTIGAGKQKTSGDTVVFRNTSSNACALTWEVDDSVMASDTRVFKHYFNKLKIYDIKLTTYVEGCAKVSTSRVHGMNYVTNLGDSPPASGTTRVYPNPLSYDKPLRVEVPEKKVAQQFVLLDITGRVVASYDVQQGGTFAFLPELEPGLYLYRIGSIGNWEHGKLQVY